MSYLRQVDTHKTALGYDAWGRGKSVSDKSMFSGLFTYDVPYKMWKELVWDGSEYVEQTSFTGAVSTEGALHFSSSSTLNGKNELRSKEHVRYQPNRGHLYSTSVFLPQPSNRTIRRFGLILPCNGMFYELVGDGDSYTLSFVIRNHFVDTKYDITALIPTGTDLSKGNLYDIQMQWRGIGDFMCYINQKLVFSTSDLGARDLVSIENPSLPVGYECENLGDTSKVVVGCVDVTSEGGSGIQAKYESFTTGVAMPSIASAGSAVIAVRMPYKINYNGVNVCYSRDAVLSQISTFCKDEAVVSIYIARGPYLANLPGLAWEAASTGFIESIIGGDGSSLDDAFQLDKDSMTRVISVRQEKDFALRVINPSPSIAPFALTADTYIVVEFAPDASTTGGCTIEVAEQI